MNARLITLLLLILVLAPAVVASADRQFIYDGDGNLVCIVEPDGRKRYFLIDDLNPTGLPQVVEELEGADPATAVVTHVNSFGLDLISRRDAVTGEMEYPVTDGLGSVRAVTDDAGSISTTRDYDAFGTEIHSAGNGEFPYGFAGERFDPVMALYNNRARFLNPATGRFMTMDGFEGFDMDPLSLHKYLYAHGNPVSNTDPTGNFSLVEVLVVTAVLAILAGENLSRYVSVLENGRRALRGKPVLEVAAGLRGQLDWVNPDPPNEFRRYFAGDDFINPWTMSEMNCFQFILYSAWISGKAGYSSRNEIKNRDNWAFVIDISNPQVYSSANLPDPGDLVAFYPKGSSVPAHVALSSGHGRVWNLWLYPFGSAWRVSETTVDDLIGYMSNWMLSPPEKVVFGEW